MYEEVELGPENKDNIFPLRTYPRTLQIKMNTHNMHGFKI